MFLVPPGACLRLSKLHKAEKSPAALQVEKAATASAAAVSWVLENEPCCCLQGRDTKG